MSKKIKVIKIIATIMIIFLAMVFIEQKIYAADADYNFRDIPKGLLLKQSKAASLVGKIFNNGLELEKSPARNYLSCVEEYNRNLSNGNHYWRAARVIDVNMKNTEYKDPLNATGYASSTAKKETNTMLNAKLAAYAYFQNSYGIDAYKTGYKNTLKNLVNELNKSENNDILVSYGESDGGYSGLIGTSDIVNSELSNTLTNYAKFAKAYDSTKGKLFNYTESKSLAYNNNLIGPYDLNLADGAAQKTISVNHTASNISDTSSTKTTNITTGVQVYRVTIELKQGSSININNSTTNKLQRKDSTGKMVNINFSTFDWKSSFYINVKGLDSSNIKSIKLYYKYDLYYARYAVMSGHYGSKKYSDQGYMAFQGKKKSFTQALSLGLPPEQKVNNGILKLTKVDASDESKKIEGAKFQILKAVGTKYTIYKTVTTNADGYATATVPLGYTYYIQEIEGTNDKYDYNKLALKSSSIQGSSLCNVSGKRAIKITAFAKNAEKDVTLQIVATNPIIKEKPKTEVGSGQILKLCSETGAPVEGVTFTLVRTRSHDGYSENYGSATSGSDGNVNFGSLDMTYTYYIPEERSRIVEYYVPYETQVDEDGDGVMETVTMYAKGAYTEYYWVDVPYEGRYSYVATETATNERYIYTNQSTSVGNGVVTVYNTPKKVRIKGKVFEDIAQGKETLVDGIFSGEDKSFEGITVTLCDCNDSKFIKTTKTNVNGEYEFGDLSQFRPYFVKFTYDGQEYMATYYNVGGNSNYGKNSLAFEEESERKEFNESFETISALTDPNMNRLINSYTEREAGKYYIYDNKDELGSLMEITSNEIIFNNVNLGLVKRQKSDMALEKDVYSATVKIKDYEQTYRYNTRKLDSDFSTWDIKDRLNVEGYYSKVYNREVYASDYEYKCELYNNAGLSVSTDTELKVYITYIIKVKNCSQSVTGKINEIVDYYDSDYTFVPEMSYMNINNSTEELTTSDITRFGMNKNFEGFKNLYITGLDDYELITGDYINMYVTFEVNKDKDKNILIDQDLQTMKITTGKENLAEISAYSTYYGENTIIPNMEEEQAGEIAGIVDIDSTPANLTDANKYDVNNYEDDTGKAPNITVTLSTTVRQMSGFAWEDERTLYNQSYRTNIGNGIREGGENLINDVTVQLVEKVDDKEIVWKTFKTGDKSDLKAIFGLNINGKDYITINSNEISKGKYIFKSYLPGEYFVRFSYGDTPGTAISSDANWFGTGISGANKKSYNGLDYKSTIYQVSNASESNNCDARDIWNRRQEVSEYAKIIQNSKANELRIFNTNIYNDANKNLTKLNEAIQKTKMDAISDDMTVEVETVDVNNIDLGVTERPKTQLVLNKTVENVKVILSDGTILYDAREKMSHVIWNSAVEGHTIQTKKGIIDSINLRNKKGLIQLTVDEEYMTGSTVQITYKITVTNNSEVDYNEQQFYYTGTVDDMNNVVKTSATKVIDYVENDIGFNESLNSGWKVVEKVKGTDGKETSKLLEAGYISGNNKDVVDSYNTIIMTEDLAKQLAPGESTSKELILSKTLATTQESTSFNNMAEIVEISNTTGRLSVDSIPGDQDPTTNPSQVDSEDSETVTILTPFGGAKIAAQRALIIVVGMTVIATGIIVIRRKVLKIKKK